MPTRHNRESLPREGVSLHRQDGLGLLCLPGLFALPQAPDVEHDQLGLGAVAFARAFSLGHLSLPDIRVVTGASLLDSVDLASLPEQDSYTLWSGGFSDVLLHGDPLRAPRTHEPGLLTQVLRVRA